ncbi:MAG: helix-turn-helix transcriptional regulator [Rhodobacteraceae bacterium]|nr:helix-turn-helix transcriptional regulator [Paracoccaceae bacterium]
MTADSDPLAALRRDPEAMAALLRVMGNASRLSILCLLAERECPVAEIGAVLGIRQPALSQQLAQLRDAGFLQTRRESRRIHYALADTRIRAVLAALGIGTTREPTVAAPAMPPAPRRPLGEAARFARVQGRAPR